MLPALAESTSRVPLLRVLPVLCIVPEVDIMAMIFTIICRLRLNCHDGVAAADDDGGGDDDGQSSNAVILIAASIACLVRLQRSQKTRTN